MQLYTSFKLLFKNGQFWALDVQPCPQGLLLNDFQSGEDPGDEVDWSLNNYPVNF